VSVVTRLEDEQNSLSVGFSKNRKMVGPLLVANRGRFGDLVAQKRVLTDQIRVVNIGRIPFSNRAFFTLFNKDNSVESQVETALAVDSGLDSEVDSRGNQISGMVEGDGDVDSDESIFNRKNNNIGSFTKSGDKVGSKVGVTKSFGLETVVVLTLFVENSNDIVVDTDSGLSTSETTLPDVDVSTGGFRFPEETLFSIDMDNIAVNKADIVFFTKNALRGFAAQVVLMSFVGSRDSLASRVLGAVRVSNSNVGIGDIVASDMSGGSINFLVFALFSARLKGDVSKVISSRALNAVNSVAGSLQVAFLTVETKSSTSVVSVKIEFTSVNTGNRKKNLVVLVNFIAALGNSEVKGDDLVISVGEGINSRSLSINDVNDGFNNIETPDTTIAQERDTARGGTGIGSKNIRVFFKGNTEEVVVGRVTEQGVNEEGSFRTLRSNDVDKSVIKLGVLSFVALG
jgi:hypothetical protein